MHGRGRGVGTRRRRTLVGAVLAVGLVALSWVVASFAFASGSAPTSVTLPVTEVTRTSAKLEGTVNPNLSQVTECVFRYGTTPALGKTAPCTYSPGKGGLPVPVEATLTGLSESTTYHVKLFAKNAEGESLGEEKEFTTLPTAPRSNIQSPQEVGHTAATLRGLVTPNEAETECFFEWGTNPSSLEHTAACATPPGAGAEAVAETAHLEGLSESTTYYYRLVSHNSFGTDSSSKATVFTLPNQPDVGTEFANPVGTTSATLQGKVDPRAALVEECFFEWGTSTSYGNTPVPCTPSPGSGEEDVAVTGQLEGLSESTTYDYRIVAKNVFGQTTGGNREFTTEPTAPRAHVTKTDEIGARSAVLKGNVNLEGAELTECVFEYGFTPALGQEVPCSTVPGHNEGFVKVRARVTGLTPTTSYVYRVRASNPFGTDYSGEETLTTFETGLLPVITKLAPKKGSATGGTTVKVKGNHLLEVTAVRFGGVESEGIVSTSATSVTAIAPPGAGVVDVTVVSPDGSNELSAGDRYTYGPPSIATVSPGNGPVAGGTDVTVTGTGFLAGVGQTTFMFGNAPATSVECVSLNECTMVVPAGPRPKTVKVSAIVNGKGSKKSPGALFTYTP
jgi:hypothetical protein